MIIGCLLEHILAFILVSSALLLNQIAGKQDIGTTQLGRSALIQRLLRISIRGCSSFQNCAYTFVFSIQLASTIILARLDSGISAADMGACTAEITWATSLLTILPLMYIAFNSALLEAPKTYIKESKIEKAVGKSSKRPQSLRFLMFALCWLLSIYPFLSRMIQTFGPDLIGNSENQVISEADWSKIEDVCIAGITQVTSQETVAMDIFAILGSVFVCIFAPTKILWLGVQRQHPDSWLAQVIRKSQNTKHNVNTRLSLLLLVLIPVLGASQFWTILRWRSYQSQISQAAGDQDVDGEWGFGQITAITIFLPVVVQIWSGCVYD